MQFLLNKVADLALGRPRTVLLVAFLLTAASAVTVPQLEIVTSMNALMPADNPYRKGLEEFLAEFGGMGDLILVAEGDDPDAVAAFADDVAARLARRPDVVAEVFHRIPIEFFKDKALLYVPADRLTQLVVQAEAHRDEVQRAVEVRDLTGMLLLIERSMALAMKAGPELEQHGPEMIGLLTDLFRDLDGHLAGQDRPLAMPDKLYKQMARERPGFDPNGYLRSYDHKLTFVFTRSTLGDDVPSTIRFVDTVRGEAQAARKDHPAVAAFGLTGFPAHVYEDMTTVKGDLVLTSILSLIGVLILFAAAFRSLRRTVMAMVPLLSGTLMALAATWLIYGQLHLLSSAFFVILIGMGIDFGIHTVARFDEELRNGAEREAALRTTLDRAGRGILTSALTSAVAFFAIGPIEFQAFAQMGIIAGCGLLAVLLATLFELPALLVLVPTPSPRKRPEGHSPLAERAVRGLLRARVPVLVLAAALAGLAIWRTTQIPFDYNYMHLLPEGSESAEYQDKMVQRSDFSAEFAAVVATSLEQSARFSEALKSKASVARVESIGELVPGDQAEKLALLARLRPLFAGLQSSYGEPPAVDGEALGQALESLYDRVERAQELAFAGKKTGLTDVLGELIEVLESIEERLGQPGAADRATRLQARLFEQLDEPVRLLRRNLDRTEPVTVAQVPAQLRKRFASGSRFAVYAFPSGSIWEKPFLERFVADSQAVSKDATGMSVRHWAFAGMMDRDFGLAAIYAGIAIVLMLLLDFRSLRRTILAVIPLGIGVLWMLGLMDLFGVAYNFANLPGVPLIIGIGVASGVHLTHRFAQDGERDVTGAVLGTGRGILLSALTTMVAFGSLSISQHRGMASFGWVLLIGVGSCLVASLLVLPAALEVFAKFRRPGRPDGVKGDGPH